MNARREMLGKRDEEIKVKTVKTGMRIAEVEDAGGVNFEMNK